MTSRSDIIDWLINNSVEIKDIIQNVDRTKLDDTLFEDEFKDQQFLAYKTRIINKITNDLAISQDLFENCIDNGQLMGYIGVIKETK